MKAHHLLGVLAWCSGCQCVQLSDYKVLASDGGEDGLITETDAGATDAGEPGCVPDGAVDVIDALGDDSDCDGTDGVATRQLYVSSTLGNDATAQPGNPARPYATLKAAFGVLRATDAGAFDALLVATGQYSEEEVSWDTNVDVYGGRSGAGTWPASGAPSSLLGGNVGLIVQGVQGRALHAFQVRAAAADFSKASIGAVVVDGSPAFIDVELVGGSGGAGIPGGDDPIPDAGPGLPGTATAQGTTTQNPGPPGVCGGDPGFAGGQPGNGAADGQKGDGPDGGAGGPQRSCGGPGRSPVGDGAEGAAGEEGVPGADPIAFGSLAGKWLWIDADGFSGGPGGPGKPGEGGGGGGGSAIANDPASWSGGSGGSGGCPGGGGQGGRSGGPSFGLLVRSGRPVLGGRTTVQARAGGAGGAGGSGALGYPGGSSGVAAQENTTQCVGMVRRYGKGGEGGRGGAGGHGGPGGGGAGGHSIAVFCENDAGFELDAGVLINGQPGDGGAGLPGARVGLSAATYGCSP